jgi:hypothetical protein
LGLKPEIQLFYRADALVGIVPLYRRQVTRGGIVRAHSVQMMGHAWRDSGPLISEYLDVIAPPEDRREVRDACLTALFRQSGWDELVVGLSDAAQQWCESFTRLAGSRTHYVRQVDHLVSYHANLADGFSAYLKGLGQSTRRSVWNLRRRLVDEHGETRLEFITPDEIDDAFQDLNRLHELRWSRPAFQAERLDFHKSLAADLAARGELAFTRLRVAGKVVSVLYDIRKSARQYNMKMGFDPGVTSRLSLGLVHFGYAMEAASERGVRLYDFLAGPGQNFDFKQNLGQIRRELSSVQMLRGWALPTLYRVRERVRGSGNG